MNTGLHNRHWPEKSACTSNPGLTAAATHWLADHGSLVHGVEGPSTDKAGTKGFPSHRVCRDRGLVHYEWLCNLEQLVGKGEFQFSGFPLKWVGGTGSPCRAIAEVA
jgi:kynurenine formamidase